MVICWRIEVTDCTEGLPVEWMSWMADILAKIIRVTILEGMDSSKYGVYLTRLDLLLNNLYYEKSM